MIWNNIFIYKYVYVMTEGGMYDVLHNVDL